MKLSFPRNGRLAFSWLVGGLLGVGLALNVGAAPPLEPEEEDAKGRTGAAIVLEMKDGVPVIPQVAPATSYYVFVNGSSFQPEASTVSYDYGTLGCMYNSGAAGATFRFPLRLPDGATVRYLRLYYNRTGSLANTAYLTVYSPGSTYSNLVTLNATQTTAGLDTVVSSQQSIVIDNYNSVYNLVWYGAAGSTNKLCGMKVAYEVPSQGTYTPITPCRVIDTRGISPPTPPYGAPALTGGVARDFQVTGTCSVPTGAVAVSANVSVTNTGSAGYLAIWTQGTAWPGNATVNYSAAAQTVGNYAILPLSATGKIAAEAFNTGTTDLIIDVTGWYY